MVDLSRTRRGDRTQHFVAYRYTAEGELHRRRVEIARQEWQKLQVGSRLPVRYLPSMPELSLIQGYGSKGVPLWVVPLVPACLLLATWPIVYHLRRQWRLLAEGRAASARVTRTERISHSHGTSHRVHYEFQILSGATRAGHYDVSKKAPEVGATLNIVYEPDDPRRQARYPLSLVRVG